MSRIGEEEPFGETAIPDYFKNTPEEDITWVLEYNGITFYFDPGAVAPTIFGIQIATVTFAQYPDLFNEKYTAVPEAYIVNLPVSSSFLLILQAITRRRSLLFQEIMKLRAGFITRSAYIRTARIMRLIGFPMT